MNNETSASMENNHRPPSQEELRAAFLEQNQGTVAKARKKRKKPLSKMRKIAIAVVSVGAVILVAGVGFLLFKLFGASTTDDAEFLTKIQSWQREDAPSVVWEFTEIGKGTLTTNAGENEYDFAWALEDGKLKIDTDWLYTLNDEYDYQIDQNGQKLTISNEEDSWTFVPESAERTDEAKANSAQKSENSGDADSSGNTAEAGGSFEIDN